MPDVTVERRSAPRYPLVVAAEVVELPRGARPSARTCDVSRTGCYIDTLNPVPHGSRVRCASLTKMKPLKLQEAS
jgi:hypothetical protein